jgi:uncharacterized membrane protein YccC
MLGGWLLRNLSELQLSLRITVAGLVSFGLARGLSVGQSYWAVLTAVIVMQGSVGGSLKAMLDRTLGTLAGAAWGAVVALVFREEHVVWLGLALAAALLPLGIVAAFRPAYRVAPITAIIVVMSSIGQEVDPLLTAGERLAEVILGSVVALGVALLILPARAHALLAQEAARTVGFMAELSACLLAGIAGQAELSGVPSLKARIRGSIAHAETVGEEAQRERASHLTDAPDPEPLLRTLRRLRHDFGMLSRLAADPLPESIRAPLAEPLAGIARDFGSFLAEAAAALAGRGSAPASGPVLLALEAYNDVMTRLHQDGTLATLPGEAVGRAFGLAFVLDQLKRNLDDLSERCAELVPLLPGSDGFKG